MELVYPIPKENLIKRFKPLFTQFHKTRNATLVALPFAGRTSHLRFINSQPDLQIELGKPVTDKFFWVDSEKCKNLAQVACEICLQLNPQLINHPGVISQDEYLLLALVKATINSFSTPVIVGISLDRTTLQWHADVERQLTLLLKQCPNLKILWSIDSFSYRNYSLGHSSVSVGESVFFFPTFSAQETEHSLSRISKSRQKKISKNVLKNCLSITGGLAGLFHSLVFYGESFIALPQAEEIINVVSQEITLSPELATSITTPFLREFIASQSRKSYSIGPLKLQTPPTAQEVNLLNLFLEKENQHLTRDEIASVLWKGRSDTKYSDWAIDKSISRLRKNLISRSHQLLTIKGLGYSLICLTH